MKRILGFLLSVVFVFGLAACDEAEVEKVDNNNENETTSEENNGEDNEANNENEAENNSNNVEENEDEDLQVGDTVNFDGLEITLNEVRNEPGGEFDEPDEDLFVVANLTVENTTDEEETVSSILNVELRDDEGYTYSTTILMDGTKGQLDGSVEPGGTLRGEIPFDVPESDTYELHFSNPFKSGKAIWTFSFDELQ
ncbi:MAG TPA: DUF4352 domain-containing protein [Bacillota bacterium]|nr:DUF4352 domain-containing protein [Bacillota bacterium]